MYSGEQEREKHGWEMAIVISLLYSKILLGLMMRRRTNDGCFKKERERTRTSPKKKRKKRLRTESSQVG